MARPKLRKVSKSTTPIPRATKPVPLESDHKDTNFVRTIEPDYHEIRNFKSFIQGLREKYPNEHAFKIKPPSTYKPGSEEVPPERLLPHLIDQTFKKIKMPKSNDYIYEIQYSEPYSTTHVKFREKADPVVMPFTKQADIENEVWSMLTTDLKSTYSISNPFSLYSDTCHQPNLKRFTVAESLVHPLDLTEKDPIMGITTPYVYFGSAFTFFGFHIEDANLCSINFLHRGEPKFWYIVHPDDMDAFEALINEFRTVDNVECDNYARHKAILIPPSLMSKHNIRFGRILQNPGEIVIVFPGVYHGGFNCGYNEAEAVNFAHDFWIEKYLQYSMCKCSQNKYFSSDLALFIRKYVQNKEKIAQTKKFPCDQCGLHFSSIGTRNRHVRTLHQSIEKFKCDVCGLIFDSMEAGIDHFTSTHTGMVFYAETSIVSLKLPNSKESRPVKEKSDTGYSVCCFLCKTDKIYTKKLVMRKHYRNIHGKFNWCGKCNIAFDDEESFKSHFADVHPSKRRKILDY